MSKDKFTISEIKKYILSQDSLGDVMYNLTAENIIKANEVDPIVQYKEWLADTFQTITEDTHNGEIIENIEIEGDDDDIWISFIVNAGRRGNHLDNAIEIKKKIGYSEVKIRICELLEGSGIEKELENKIKENITELLNLKLDE